jgi:hypothetical protein
MIVYHCQLLCDVATSAGHARDERKMNQSAAWILFFAFFFKI